MSHSEYYSLDPNASWSYSGFVTVLTEAGYTVETLTSSEITYDRLAPYLAFVIPLAQSAPSAAENAAMQQYVEQGGGLFLIADWGGGFSGPSQALANTFGVTLDANIVTDPTEYIDGVNNYIHYVAKNFSSHDIMHELANIQTYTSTSIQPGNASPLITTNANADPPERPVAAALNFGAGRVVVLGDSNYFDNNHGLYVGDNKQFAINITNWLAGQSGKSSTDQDGDGLSNSVETTGWDNAAGHFVTNPNNADTDGDGLSDGEEKMFDTNPLDNTSPGIFALYNNTFKTKRYDGWRGNGGHYLATDWAVVRRGSSFSVGGPRDASIQVTPLVDSQTTLSPVWNASTGLWNFKIGSGDTVGEYTVTLTKDAWSKSLKLYVVFELPTDLSDSDEKAYVYDETSAEKRDDTSIWFGTSEDVYYKWLFFPRHKASGYGLEFRTEQYGSEVMGDVMKAISGVSSREDAANKLGKYLDEITRFDAQKPHFTMTDVLHSEDLRNQCSNIANALTSFSRAAGIAARPVVVDWDGTLAGSGQFDHATEVWLNGQWKTMRAYDVMEGGEDTLNPPAGGYNPPTDRRTWGSNEYPDAVSDVIVTAGSDWSPAEVTKDASIKAYEWDNDQPDSILKKEWLQTENVPYWGWNSEPTRTGNPSSTVSSLLVPASFTGSYLDYKVDANEDGMTEFLAVDAGIEVNEAGTYKVSGELYDNAGNRVSADAQVSLAVGAHVITVNFPGIDIFRTRSNGPYNILFTLLSLPGGSTLDQGHYTSSSYGYTEFETPAVYFTDQFTESTIDANSDGHFDSLAIDTQIQVVIPGSYTIIATLADGTGTGSVTDGTFTSSRIYAPLASGTQTVRLLFSGKDIFTNGENGPYTIKDIFISSVENPTPSDLSTSLLDRRFDAYTTVPYAFDSFETPSAFFTRSYSDSGIDTNSDGKDDWLAINVDLGTTDSGTYSVSGDLTDINGTVLASAQWSGASGPASLLFDGNEIWRGGKDGPYYLRHLRLLNEATEIINQIDDAYVTGPYSLAQFQAPAVRLTGTYSDAGLDTDGNGLYNYLALNAQVEVANPGDYSLEGWLTDPNGSLVTWATSGAQSLSTGEQVLTLQFDGNAISANGVSGKFSISQIKLVRATQYAVLDEAGESTPTTAYLYTAFEGASLPAGVAFTDNGENGTTQWTAEGSWALTETDAHSSSHSWTDSPEGNYADNSNSSITSISIVLSSLTDPVLSFWTRYALEAGGDYGYVEVSVNGIDWTTVGTYTGTNDRWTNEVLSLRNFAGAPSLRLRFRLFSNGSVTNDGWYVDDISIQEGSGEQQECSALTLAHTGNGSDPTASPLKSSACSTDFTYVVGETISLTASPSSNYLVGSWNGTDNDSSTSTANTLSMPNGDRTVTVNYIPVCYTLTTSVNPSDSGAITADPSPNCNSATQYIFDTVVNLTATPSSGYSLVGWSGSISGSTNPIPVTMDANKSITANFTARNPLKGTTLMYNRPTFKWDPVTGATSYTLQVSKASNFSSMVLNKTITSPSYSMTTNLSPTKTLMYWRIRPNGSNWSEVWTFTSANPPGVPSLLAPADTSLVNTYLPRLDWSISSLPTGTTFDYYQLQIAFDMSFKNVLQDLKVPGLSNSEKTLIDSLAPNGKYYWRVCAWNIAGQYSLWSSVRSFRTPMLSPVLLLPANPSTAMTTRPAFSWNTVSGATGYTIQASIGQEFTVPYFSSTVVNASVTAPTYTPNSDLPRSKWIYWRVRANGANPSSWSAPFKFFSANPPSVPSLLSPSDGVTLTAYTPTLDWNDPTGAAYYEVQVATTSTFGTGSFVIDNTTPTPTPSNFTPSSPLAANRTFFWRVRVYNAGGQYSNWSAVRHFHTTLPAPMLATPTNGQVTTLLPTFTWSPVAEATSYVIQVSTSPSFTSPTINKTVTGTTYVSISKLSAGRKYYWRVFARGAFNSPWSVVGNFTTQ